MACTLYKLAWKFKICWQRRFNVLHREWQRRAYSAKYRNTQMRGRVWIGYWKTRKASSLSSLLYRFAARPSNAFSYDATLALLLCHLCWCQSAPLRPIFRIFFWLRSQWSGRSGFSAQIFSPHSEDRGLKTDLQTRQINPDGNWRPAVSSCFMTGIVTLQVLEELIKHRWGAIDDQQREGIKNYLSNLIIKISSDEVSLRREKVFLNKLNILLVQVRAATAFFQRTGFCNAHRSSCHAVLFAQLEDTPSDNTPSNTSRGHSTALFIAHEWPPL